MTKSTEKRGRPKIKPYIEEIIISRVLRERKKPQEAMMPPKVLAFEIQEEIKQHIKRGDHVPELSTLEKRVLAYRSETDPRDKPWSIFSLREYPISAEALPLVMSIWEKCLLGMQSTLCESWYLTIREALWIAQLYKVIEFYYEKQMTFWKDHSNAEHEAAAIRFGDLPENYREIKFEDIVLDWAYAIATVEESSEIQDEDFYVTEREVHMVANVFEYYGERWADFIYNVAEVYGIDPNILPDSRLYPNVSIVDIERVATNAFIESRNLQLFQIPKTEISKLSHEAQEALDLDSAVPILGRNRDKMVIVPAKRDADNELLSELSKYSVDIKYTKEEEMGAWRGWGVMALLVRNIIEKEEGGTK
jgi:hypothetical protein